MAVTTESTSFVNALHFIARWIGLNGLVAVAVGLMLWFPLGYENVGSIVVIAGASAVGLALLGEVRGVAGAVASQRGAAGVNVLLQIAFAVFLVVAINGYSFFNYQRFDLTADKAFTLKQELRDKLAKLRGDTDIIVYLQHVSFGQRVELRQDDYDQTAEKIIAKKVEDLVEQFREIGPRFRVTVYDTQKKNKKEIRRKINEMSGEALTKEQQDGTAESELLKDVEKAPENSIFFFSKEPRHLQRIGFNDIFYLDKQASQQANNGKGNVVLIDQGLQTFTDKVFKIEERKPRVAFAVVHGFLGQEGSDEYGMPGFKSALVARGIEGRDIILYKNLLSPDPSPAALEFEESRYEVLELMKGRFEDTIEVLEDEIKEYLIAKPLLAPDKIDEFNRKFVFYFFAAEGYRPKTREWVQRQLQEAARVGALVRPPLSVSKGTWEDGLKLCVEGIEYNEREIATYRKKLDKVVAEQAKLPVDNLGEQRRFGDVREKFKRLAANIDLLVIPRLTWRNLIERRGVRSDLHTLDKAHIDAIKDFMKAGKPVLFCVGPPIGAARSDKDSLEELLSAFRVTLPNQTILHTAEGEAMEERDEKTEIGGAAIELPPAAFEWKSSAMRFAESGAATPSPVRTSLRVTSRGFLEKNREALRVRYARPVYVETWTPETVGNAIASLAFPGPAGTGHAWHWLRQKKYNENAVFMMTHPDCWNEDRSLIATAQRAPHFEKPKVDDPNNFTLLERRMGPFPVGVALEADVPAEWYDGDDKGTHKKVRLAVIGDGSLFVGDKLSPMREKLFLDVTNWLLGRENLLTRESSTWQYPRLGISAGAKNLWEWAARLGLPLVFVYIGLNVWLVRRMR
ncbi:MAG: hypothetical protein FJ303_06015 [Planctomycetes bacterium]|nr:hypothetical protein [Planctomycetota bacterium]